MVWFLSVNSTLQIVSDDNDNDDSNLYDVWLGNVMVRALH